MLFISPHLHYQLVGIIDEHIEYHPTNGRVLSVKPSVDAEFFHGGAPSWAIEQAMENANFNKVWDGALPDDQPRRAMISSFDTEQQNWDADTREYVEQAMLAHPDYGIRYVRAIPKDEFAPIPWPNYEKTQWMQVPVIARDIGCDLQQVLDYERHHKNRPVLIERLEKAIAEDAALPKLEEEEEPLVPA